MSAQHFTASCLPASPARLWVLVWQGVAAYQTGQAQLLLRCISMKYILWGLLLDTNHLATELKQATHRTTWSNQQWETGRQAHRHCCTTRTIHKLSREDNHNQRLDPIYPSTHAKEQKKTRVITLMNSKCHTENWEQLKFQSDDIVVVKITGSWGQLIVFNIDNDCQHNHTINELMKFYRTNSRTLPEGYNDKTETWHVVWLGNFNRHHPAWDNPEEHRLFTR